VRESKDRVKSAIKNSGFEFPSHRITVNLAPAGIRKAGAALDLPIAMGILLGSEQVRSRGAWGLIGELSLSGEVRRVPGILPLSLCLSRAGVTRVVVAAEASTEAALAPSATPIGVASLLEAVEVVSTARSRRRRAARARVDLADVPGATGEAQVDGPSTEPGFEPPDLADVRGQLEARRALEIALAGEHGVVFVGPPGSGKTLLARTIPPLLPPPWRSRSPDSANSRTRREGALGSGPCRSLLS
jgi:magnesium chelatase family protein